MQLLLPFVYILLPSLSTAAGPWEPGEAEVVRGRAEGDSRRGLHQRGDEGGGAAATGAAGQSAAVRAVHEAHERCRPQHISGGEDGTITIISLLYWVEKKKNKEKADGDAGD